LFITILQSRVTWAPQDECRSGRSMSPKTATEQYVTTNTKLYQVEETWKW